MNQYCMYRLASMSLLLGTLHSVRGCIRSLLSKAGSSDSSVRADIVCFVSKGTSIVSLTRESQRASTQLKYMNVTLNLVIRFEVSILLLHGERGPYPALGCYRLHRTISISVKYSLRGLFGESSCHSSLSFERRE